MLRPVLNFQLRSALRNHQVFYCYFHYLLEIKQCYVTFIKKTSIYFFTFIIIILNLYAFSFGIVIILKPDKKIRSSLNQQCFNQADLNKYDHVWRMILD